MTEWRETDSIRPGVHIDILTNIPNPYRIYKSWREEHPVFQLEPHGFWAVCGYADVKFASRRHDIFSSVGVKIVMQPEWLEESYWRDFSFLVQDAPDHMKSRKLVNKEFGLKAVKLFIPFIEKAAHSLISEISPDQEIEFLEGVAAPFSSGLIDHIIGTENSQKLSDIQEYSERNKQNILSKPDGEYIENLQNSVLNINQYFDNLIQKRRANPKDDLISKLLSTKLEGEKLTDDMVSNLVELLLLAGTNTLSHFLCHGMIQLSRSPDLFYKLKKKPELIPDFIEELLRHSTIGPISLRKTTEAVILSGVTIPKGEIVLLFLASANRDATIFPDPDDFIMKRANIHEHLAFGIGAHQCLGRHLLRLEAKIIVECILKSFNGISCPEEDQLEWNNSWIMNSIEKLPVRFR
ncbi:MAG: cytochrome P450 [Emcibacter sp.]|nr:cytochrome P450 [Emcibacter sp.]